MADLRKVQLKYATFGYGVLWASDLELMKRNATMNILNIYQGGICLGQKEYYLDTDPATTAIREAYKKHIERMFKLFGFSVRCCQEEDGEHHESRNCAGKGF